MKNHAFTLIEVLIVVLIIGILAAIAVPQYQIAVAKADFVQIQSIFKEIFRARQLYLTMGGKPNNQDLTQYPDLHIPAGTEAACSNPAGEIGNCIPSGDSNVKNWGGYSVATGTTTAQISYKKHGYNVRFKMPVYGDYRERPEGYFYIKCAPESATDTKSKKLCRILSGGKDPTTCNFVSGDCWIIE